MKKIIFLLSILIFTLNLSFADEAKLLQQNKIQSRIDFVGTKILNSNKLDKRVVFVSDKDEKISILKGAKSLTKRQVIVYETDYKYLETEDELAGYLSREIAAAVRSYEGLGNGWLTSIKLKAAPKKYEIVFDKIAVDYMVEAGYNPLGLITYINKAFPQGRFDKFSSTNLTSKRLANIYERIYREYPSFLKDNEYLENEYYQNFLLTSQENRKLLHEKIRHKDWTRDIEYE